MTSASSVEPDPSLWAEAWRDLVESLRLAPFWLSLAYQRVRGRYQRLALGLLWHPLSYAFVVTSLGLMWSQIMGRPAAYFMPYLAIGFATWFFIFNAIAGATDILKGASRHITARPTPVLVFVFERIAANLMQFALEAPFFFVMAIVVGREFGWLALLAVPGLLLLLLNALWASVAISLLAARFPDVGEIIRNVMRIVFFLTPVIWSIDINPRIEEFVAWNPFYHAMEVVRAPFMGSVPDAVSYIIVGAIAIGGSLLAVPAFALSRRRVPYWL